MWDNRFRSELPEKGFSSCHIILKSGTSEIHVDGQSGTISCRPENTGLLMPFNRLPEGYCMRIPASYNVQSTVKFNSWYCMRRALKSSG
jgi:hypothetical protein